MDSEADTFQYNLRISVDVRMEFYGSVTGQVKIEDEHSFICVDVANV